MGWIYVYRDLVIKIEYIIEQLDACYNTEYRSCSLELPIYIKQLTLSLSNPKCIMEIF